MSHYNSDDDIFVSNYTIRIIKNGIQNDFSTNKKHVAMNFNYFDCLFRFNDNAPPIGTLDFDLSFESIKLCHDLALGQVELNPDLNYYLIVDILEVYNVLQCKAGILLYNIVLNLTNRLDVEDKFVVKKFCTTIKNNDKICPTLKNTIILRLSYLFNNQLARAICDNDADTSDWNKIVLVIRPVKKWSVLGKTITRYCEPICYYKYYYSSIINFSDGSVICQFDLLDYRYIYFDNRVLFYVDMSSIISHDDMPIFQLNIGSGNNFALNINPNIQVTTISGSKVHKNNLEFNPNNNIIKLKDVQVTNSINIVSILFKIKGENNPK